MLIRSLSMCQVRTVALVVTILLLIVVSRTGELKTILSAGVVLKLE